MSRVDRALEPSPRAGDLALRSHDAIDRQPDPVRGDAVRADVAWPVDRPIPAAVTDDDLMAIVRIKSAAFYRRKALGEFQFLELRALTGGNTRYSGHLITRWLRGELAMPGDTRRFFGGAGKRGPRKAGADQAVAR